MAKPRDSRAHRQIAKVSLGTAARTEVRSVRRHGKNKEEEHGPVPKVSTEMAYSAEGTLNQRASVVAGGDEVGEI